jgi:putative FmdB family regulatory protein
MPIYEYECTSCGIIEEHFQKFSEKPFVKRKHCGGKLHKLISHSSFHLKGTGWYVTDYANKARPNSAALDATQESKGSQDSKPSTQSKTSASSTDSSTS